MKQTLHEALMATFKLIEPKAAELIHNLNGRIILISWTHEDRVGFLVDGQEQALKAKEMILNFSNNDPRTCVTIHPTERDYLLGGAPWRVIWWA